MRVLVDDDAAAGRADILKTPKHQQALYFSFWTLMTIERRKKLDARKRLHLLPDVMK
jgi:hypothetical protein